MRKIFVTSICIFICICMYIYVYVGELYGIYIWMDGWMDGGRELWMIMEIYFEGNYIWWMIYDGG